MPQATAEFRVNELRERVKARLKVIEDRLAEFGHMEMDPRGCYIDTRDGFQPHIAREQASRYAALLGMLDLTTGGTIRLDCDTVLKVLLGE